MKYNLTLFFKMGLITEFMDKFDMTDGSHKVFCEIFDISIDTKDENWWLSPAVVEVLEESFNKEGVLNSLDKQKSQLCGIFDHVRNVFYNFTDKKEQITMFSNGKNFAYFDTQNDIKSDLYVDAYKNFVFNDKQAKNDKYVYNLSGWLQ